MTKNVICEVRGLKKYFPIYGGIFLKKVGYVHAVDGVSFDLIGGETLGLVGESGCGKTTTGRCIMGAIPPTEGSVSIIGVDIFKQKESKLREIRKQLGVVFQDPFSSLNPRWTVGDIVGEPLSIHKISKGRERNKRVKEVLNRVGLSPHHVSRYPHEFSGGQKQRIAIARALVANPKFIIADEPVAALDMSLRSGILNLMKNLQKEMELTYLFISHDLSVVKHMSNRIAVMYLGKILELAKTKSLFRTPMHPYTKALISAVPVPDPTFDIKRILLSGDVPSPINPPSGCRFHTRCNVSTSNCKKEDPELLEVKKDYFVACHLAR